VLLAVLLVECSAAGFIVSALKNVLSASVTVRRSA
jgi:hypothetical protein